MTFKIRGAKHNAGAAIRRNAAPEAYATAVECVHQGFKNVTITDEDGTTYSVDGFSKHQPKPHKRTTARGG